MAAELSGGAPYLRDWLIGGADYQGPYGDKKGLDSIETPDDLTIVFHLNKPEGEFPYLATQTQFTPVPKAKGNGTKYEEHPISSGPYKVVKNENDGERLTLECNTYWSASTDAERKVYPDKIDVRSGLDSSVINQRLSASQGADATAVTTDTNLGPAELAKVTGDKELRFARRHRTLRLHELHRLQPEGEALQQPQGAPGDLVRPRPYVGDQRGGRLVARRARDDVPAGPEVLRIHAVRPLPAGKSGNPAKAKELLKEAGYKRLQERAHHHAHALQRQGLRDQPGDRDRHPGRPEKGRDHGQAPGSGDQRLQGQDPQRQDRAGLLPRPLGRRLALGRPLPGPDLRRPADRQGRRQLQHRLPQ